MYTIFTGLQIDTSNCPLLNILAESELENERSATKYWNVFEVFTTTSYEINDCRDLAIICNSVLDVDNMLQRNYPETNKNLCLN